MARLIAEHSQLGQKILALLCGSGTSVAEAVYADRHAIGVDNDQRWATVAAANLARARDHGATGTGHLMRADACYPPGEPRRLWHNVDLLIATPPTRLRLAPSGHPSHGTADLVRLPHSDLILRLDSCAPLLRPGGAVAVVTRLIQRRGQARRPYFRRHSRRRMGWPGADGTRRRAAGAEPRRPCGHACPVTYPPATSRGAAGRARRRAGVPGAAPMVAMAGRKAGVIGTVAVACLPQAGPVRCGIVTGRTSPWTTRRWSGQTSLPNRPAGPVS